MAVTDAELVERSLKGDRRAFQSLVERYQHRAFSIAFGILRREEDALDVVQEAFIKVFKHLDGFQGNASFYTWLYRIVANLAIDQLRRRGRNAESSFDDAIKHNEDFVGDEADLMPSRLGLNPYRELARAELLAEMNRALETLSPTHRAILLMREQEGLSYEDLANVMQCSKGTIMSRLHHARKNLQAAMAGYLQGTLEID